MENSNQISNPLFRFISLRTPELGTNITASKNFVSQANPEAGTMYNLVQTHGSLAAAAASFTPFASDVAMRQISPALFSFSDWLSGAGASATLAETRLMGANAPGTLSAANENALWDNLFYQMATGQSDYQKETILKALVAYRLADQLNGDSATEEDLVQMRTAKVVIPKAILGITNDAAPDAAPLPDFQGNKELRNTLEILQAKDAARRYEQAIQELTKVKAGYDKAEFAAYAEAQRTYDESVTTLLAEAGHVSGDTPPAIPDIPAFDYTPTPEMLPATLAAQLSPESHYLMETSGILADAETYKAAFALLDKGLRDATATLFDRTALYKTTVMMGGVQFSGSSSGEKNTFMSTAFEVAPQTYKVALAVNTGDNKGTDEVISVSYNLVGAPDTTYNSFEAYEIDGAKGILLDINGSNVVNSSGNIKLEAIVLTASGTQTNVITESPIGKTDRGRTIDNSSGGISTDPATGNTGIMPSVYGIRRLGIADYQVVEQTVCCYVPGEVSHIENIMAKEYKERSTRKLRRSEDTTTSEVSSEKENQHDTSSADRFELQQEVSKVIAQNNSLAVGASSSLSGKYAGSVQFGLNANANYSTNLSKTQSMRQAQTYAREVTTRATERLLEKVRDERVNKIIDEYEEQNKHGFDNRGDNAENISGVYRWVDKIYENKILNYGKRLMYEFLIPEPATFHKLGMIHSVNPQSAATLQAPSDPRTTGSSPLASHLSVSRINYTYWAAAYGADVEAPPEDILSVGKSFSKSQYAGNADGGYELYADKEDFTLPDDYHTTGATLVISGHSDEDGTQRHSVGATIGNLVYSDKYGASASMTFMTFNRQYIPIPINTTAALKPYEKTIPLSVYAMNYNLINFTINLDLKLNNAAYEKWQANTFLAIIKAYQDRLDEYNKANAAAQTSTSQVLEANPLFYRTIENTVLKKNCMDYLVGQNYLGQGYVVGTTFANVAPAATAAQDSYTAVARFMEQAFEWEEMSYNFYPFYWGLKSNWADLYANESDDPLFRAFMQAGLARVIATVRPGFEDAVMYFMATGQVWNGGAVPVINDPLYLTIADELAHPVYEVDGSWETRVPTTLTVIQKSSVGLYAGGLPCNTECEDEKYFFSSDNKLALLNGTNNGSTADWSDDFQQLTSDMIAWWKADAGTTATGSLVTAWTDQTGNNYTITPPSASAAPSLIAGWNNNKPALAFTGAQALRLPLLNIPASTQDFSIFMVGEKTGLATGCCFELSDMVNSHDAFAFFLNDSLGIDSLYVQASAGYDVYGIPSNITNNVKGIYDMRFYMGDPDPETSCAFNDTLYQVHPAGLVVPETDHIGQHFASDSFNIGSRAGSSTFANFSLAELILIPRKVTAAERLTVKNYLKTKYGF